MTHDEPPGESDASLRDAIDPWLLKGKPARLERWLTAELDASGAPTRLPLAAWPGAIGALAAARRTRPGWADAVDERTRSFVRMLLRFSRPDGRLAASDGRPAATKEIRAFWKAVATAFPADDIGRVLGWWFPDEEVEPSPPPLPAWSSPDRVLGVLRADWTSRGDLLTFDQREDRGSTRFELFGSGVTWLGPHWSSPDGIGSAPPAAAKPTAWATNSSADVAEWTFRSGGRRITRLVMMLRGRRLALLADQLDDLRSTDSPETRLAYPEGMTLSPLPAPASMLMKPAAAGKSAQAIQLGGGLLGHEPESRRLTLRQVHGNANGWLPLLLSWDHARHRKVLTWDALTVAQSGKRCPSTVAWAARVSWGRDETFVFYRSLGPAERRSFLGCSTTARFLVGRFTPEGDVEPIVTLD